MQKMRRLILWLVLCAWCGPACAVSIRVMTWNMHNFPSGVMDLRAPEAEPANHATAAAVIRRERPDVLVMQEIRDSAAVQVLLDSVGIPAYRLLVCSRFCDPPGIPLFQQVAIVSRLPLIRSGWKKWATLGAVDPPRGFAYAMVRNGGEVVLICGVHLKSNMVKDSDRERAAQLNILQRELAVQQLVRFIETDRALAAAGLAAAVVAGDFNTNRDDPQFTSERTLAVLDEAGFAECFAGLSTEQRLTWRGSGAFAAATFDYVFVRGLTYTGRTRVVAGGMGDHDPVVVDVGR